MNFAFSEEQEELRRYARQWLTERMPLERVRALMSTPEGHDRGDWLAVAELGWQAMAIPEAYGGAGFGLLEVAVLLEEQGRSLFCGPYLSTVVGAANAVLLAGSEEQKSEILGRIATGEATATLAVTEGTAGHEGEHLGTAAVRRDGTWVIDGVKRHVIDGHTADLLVVAAQTADGIGMFVVDPRSEGVTTSALPTMDETRKQADISFAQVVVGDDARLPQGDASTLRRVNEILATALALEQVGGAQATLDMAVQYAKDRRQFGKPIGSFQAVKHRIADMLVDRERALSASRYAAALLDDPAVANDAADLAAVVAASVCQDAVVRVAHEAIQLHGGIGFTWEHRAHYYLRRALGDEGLFGSARQHRAAIATLIGV